MSRAIGIDLGTTNSCVAVFQAGRPVVIPNLEGSTTTPSMVAFTPAGERLVGGLAKRQILTNTESTVYSVKRLIGRKFDSAEVRQTRPLLSYAIAPAPNEDINVVVQGRTLSVPEIQAEILSNLRAAAEHWLGDQVTEAVITVPAYFNDAQRQATKDAGQIAGLKVLRIINEPTAAALAFGLDRADRRLIAVYDLGGGTFDISILEIGDGVFQVKATSGDTFLGGDDFDRRIMDHLLIAFQQAEGIDLRHDPVALQRIREAAEAAKHALSVEDEATVQLPFITITSGGPKHLRAILSRSLLEELTEDLVQRTLVPCRQALADCRLAPSDIQEVVLVGGQTRMPRVRRLVGEFFGREPHTGLNPDEVVAVGAAVQGAILKGDYQEVLLLDVTPLSLGIETKGGVFTPFIERNTTIPTRRALTFTTTEDNQSSVTVHVLQGERKMAADNISLATFDLLGIAPAPRGLPKVEVTFDLDANGILSVAARDLSTGHSQAVRVSPAGGLSPEDIGRIVGEAERHQREDQERRHLVELANQAEAALYTADNLLRSHGTQLVPEQREHLEKLVRQLRSAVTRGERRTIEKAFTEIRLVTNNIIGKLM